MCFRSPLYACKNDVFDLIYNKIYLIRKHNKVYLENGSMVNYLNFSEHMTCLKLFLMMNRNQPLQNKIPQIDFIPHILWYLQILIYRYWYRQNILIQPHWLARGSKD